MVCMKKLKYLMTLALIFVLGVLIYYYYTNRDTGGKEKEKETNFSEVDRVLSKDLEDRYPKTAREVVSYFISIQKCYYNEEYNDNELVQLAYKAMKIFDDELTAKNNFDVYYSNLTNEIKEHKEEGKTIVKVIMDKASDVIYSEIEGVKYAKMNCIYYVKTSSNTTKVTETYALRCNENGEWKILGWEVYNSSEYE